MANDPQYVTGVERRPQLDRNFQSNVKGLYIIGAANGSPLLKTCINEGTHAIQSIREHMPPTHGDGELLDLVIVGAGPAGLSAGFEAKRAGYSFAIVEQRRALNTIWDFPNGKMIYAEPASLSVIGDLDLEDSTKEELLNRWSGRIDQLDIICGTGVTKIDAEGAQFHVHTKQGDTLRARRVILAVGRMGNPRRLGCAGEDLDCVYSTLLNPGKYSGKTIIVVGGGNSAAEAVLALVAKNQVTMVHRGDGLYRLSQTNRSLIQKAEEEGRLRVLLSANVKEFRKGEVDIEIGDETETLQQDLAFTLIGADPPTAFLKRLGVRFEGQFRWSIVPQIGSVFALIYSLYAMKGGHWPFHDAHAWLHSAGADPRLLYGILYSALMTLFGLRAMRRYSDDRYQQRRYRSLIAAQWIIYFAIPWILFYAGYSAWWRTWGVTLTYPLGYYGLFEKAATLFSGAALPWAILTFLAFLLLMPIVSTYHGKRFCAWICPCGGLAETVGDRWRQKAPRGNHIRRFESIETALLVITVLTSAYLIADSRFFVEPEALKSSYELIVDFWLASVVAITLYPFAGSRVWCRFFCPLAKWMELCSRWSGGKLEIQPNNECISCGECTRYCQMGIDVRAFAQRAEPLSNLTSECIFCGICVTVCPVDVLSVGPSEKRRTSSNATR